jgi:hypothetical protein
MDIGGMPHADVLASIELLGTEVAPRVRAELNWERMLARRAEPTMLGATVHSLGDRNGSELVGTRFLSSVGFVTNGCVDTSYE